MSTIREQAEIFANMHVKLDNGITYIGWMEHPEEIRVVEVSKIELTAAEPGDTAWSWSYLPEPGIGLEVKSVMILLSPQEWEMVQNNTLSLPPGWNKESLITLYDGEDPRKTGLKNGLRQLNIRQLQRVIDYPGEMILDDCNYQDGKFCPLGIALGLDKIMTDPTHDTVYQTLTDLGYDVYNTKGIVGKFYTDHRKQDLLQAAQEVLQEKIELHADH